MAALTVSLGNRVRQVAYAAAVRLPKTGVVRVARLVPDWVTDVALAAIFLSAMLVEQADSAPLPAARQLLAVTLSVVIAGGLAVRRRIPLAAYLLGSLALVAQALWVMPSTVAPYANLVGVYSLGLYAHKARAWLGPVLVAPAVVAYFTAAGSAGGTPAPAGVLLTWLLAWAVGYGSARRREGQQAARDAMRRQVVADERTRLARELHDLVGHTVNVMVVQAGAARLVLARDPAKTQEILTGLELTGRQALAELDRMLGVLRRDPQPGDQPGAQVTARQPGLGIPADGDDMTMPGIADLPQLAQRMNETGGRVTMQIDSPSAQVARSVDLSAYRIVQEALTNSMKHGSARSASVTVRIDSRSVTIEVTDDGRGAAAGYAPGRGLLGIAERVAAFGGSLQHGRGEQGGFRLRAVLPVP